MSFHCYHEEPCPACDGFYIRFAPEVVCPWCGSDAADVYPLVEEVVQYARLTLTTQGDLDMEGYAPSTPADLYVVLGFELLEAFRQVPDADPAAVAHAAAEFYQVLADTHQRAHFEAYFRALANAWQDSRNRPLPVVPPSDSSSVPATPTGTRAARPLEAQTFQKKWPPKEL